MSDELITVYDEMGRELYVSRQEWADNVLPHNLQDAWNNADELYGCIVMALEDGFADRLMEAAGRLFQIDRNPERAATTLAIVQMKNGRLNDAEATLRTFIDRHGETGIVLTNLAKVYAERGDDQTAEQILRRGLHLDPNQDNGLGWWGAIHSERGDDAGFLAAMQKIAREPGSWRPQLWIAREHLKNQQVQQAVELYRYALRLAPDDPNALMQISGDLGNAGRLQEMLDLVLPVYDPEKHGPYAGLNLLQALLETKRMNEGRALLARMQRLNLPPFAQTLSEFEVKFAQARASAAAPAELEVVSVPIRGPIWTRGMEDPRWLLPTKDDAAPRIAFFAFADGTRKGKQAHQEIENDTGRLTRSLPLYLAEAFLFKTNADTYCVIPVVKDVGPGVAGKAWELTQMLQACPPELMPNVLVSGCFSGGLFGHKLELWVWNVASKTEMKRLRLSAKRDFSGLALPAERELMACLQDVGVIKPSSPDGVFASPPEPLQDFYLLALGQLLTQVFAYNRLVNPSNLWNERGMLTTYFQLAEQMPHAAAPKIMAACGVLCGLGYESPVAGHFKDALLKMVRAEKNSQSPLSKLSPAVYVKLGEEAESHDARERLLKDADGAYRQWLESLSA